MKFKSTDTNFIPSESFLVFFYNEVYLKIKKHLKVDIPIIDLNLMRLHHCINKVAIEHGHQQRMLNIDELPLALEFYLQFDGTFTLSRQTDR